ncbi:PDR/VanB family oxidoreductase [Streptomyces sp. NPDC050145]|uniref:PDR/VanB family oxidoreductase n=1 Tax=Streptomyces sp. NPDC050145 TaxID=3365602 RepID=UPI0037B577FE
MSAQQFVTVKVEEVTREAEDVVSYVLASRDGRVLPAWTPGSHIDVVLSRDLVRQYSLSSGPDEARWRIAVLRELEGRGGSAHLHDRVKVGDHLLVSTPRNTFPLDLAADRHVLVAGGIGITPLLPMAAALEAAGKRWTLLYLGRSATSMAFADELAEYGDKVVLHRDDESGVIDVATALDRLGAGHADLYACGPAGLLAAVEGYAGNRPGSRLVLEHFTAAPDAAGRADDRPFTVVTRDGRDITVGADESILDALSAAGVRSLSSCREGVCGTCETGVLEGAPDHRDRVLSEEERAAGDTMMICVSRCRGERLVLDV